MKCVCTVANCPERHRCLDKNNADRCAIYRAIVKKKLPTIENGGTEKVSSKPVVRIEENAPLVQPKKEEKREFPFVFPRVFAGEFQMFRQLNKIKEEVNEVEVEVLEVKFGKAGKAGLKRLAKELMNVIHACETFLRHMNLTEKELIALRDEVEADNRKRGYYV